ncbi:MAG: malate dehydrogenase [Legionellales bacterium]|nr:malate dehydrogenase [Legionellales bacterium]
MSKVVKVAVTGAAGQIGYSLLFRIASGQMFGPNVSVEMYLIELESSLESLNGIAMELEDCAFPLLKKVVCTSDLELGMGDVNWVLLVGSVPRKEGMERADLLTINGGIFSKQARAINDNAASDVRILVVGNPCNTNSLIAMNNAKNIPNDRFYAMTMLDELRAKAQLAKKAKSNINLVKNVCIWGNHSATQYPDFYHAKISGNLVTDQINDMDWLQNDFIEIVQNRGAEVIKSRGLSSAASAANAIIKTVNSLIEDTDQDELFSVCSCSNGEYGIDEGLIFSFPTKTIAGKTTIVTGINHNEFSNSKIHSTLEELRNERDEVYKLGLIK